METIKHYLPELIAFHEVHRAGGFTQAAENLNLSKSQLSKQVARLETILKVQLFHRTTRKITLTSEGKQLLSYSQDILRLSEEAAESIKEMITSRGGLIRLTAPQSLGDWFAPELIKIFSHKAPELKIEIDLTNTKRDLIEERYDFALRAMDETNPDLIARYLGHLKDVVVASAAFVKAHKIKSTDPQDLKNYNCLLNSHQSKWNSWKLQKGSKDVVVEVQGSYACSSYTTTRLMCLEALGIARLPYYLAAKDLQEGRLIRLYPDYSIATHPLYLVYAAKGDKILRRRIFKDTMMEWLKTQKQHMMFL